MFVPPATGVKLSTEPSYLSTRQVTSAKATVPAAGTNVIVVRTTFPAST